MIENHYTYAQATYDMIQNFYYKLSDERVITGIKNKPQNALPRRFKKNLETFSLEALENPNGKNAWKYLTRAQELGLGIFQSNDNPTKLFQLHYDNQIIEVVGVRDASNTNVFNWQKALFCAIITRNRDAIDYLVNVSNFTFKSAHYAEQLLPFDYAYVDLLKALFTPGADLISAIEKALVSSTPDDCPEHAVYLYSSRLEWPVVSVILGIFTDDGGVEYNQAMENAGLLHQEFFSAKDNAEDSDGIISMPLTAMAALAKDIKGYDLTTENGYIPDWLINRPHPQG